MRFMIKSCWGRTLEFLGWLFGVERLRRSGRRQRQIAELYRQAAQAHQRVAERKEAAPPEAQPQTPRTGSAKAVQTPGSRARPAAAQHDDGQYVRRIVKIRIDNILHPRKHHTGWPQDLGDRRARGL